MHMPTNSPGNADPDPNLDPNLDLDRLRCLDARAVRESVALVRRVTPADLGRPTPCAGWTLADLIAHMTAQHRGFAAAAIGRGQDLAYWKVRPLAEDARAEYGEAAEQALAAFATVTAPDRPFVLPELPGVQTVPAARAIGFHLVDHVVHSWDVARGLGLPYDPDPDVLAAALPVACAVPDGPFRLAPGSSFRPARSAGDGAGTLERILTALGRSPDWPGPSGGTASDTGQGAAVGGAPC